MRNTNVDLRNHLFAHLEALGDEDCDKDTIERAKAAAHVAKQINDSAKNEIQAAALVARYGVGPTGSNFLGPAKNDND